MAGSLVKLDLSGNPLTQGIRETDLERVEALEVINLFIGGNILLIIFIDRIIENIQKIIDWPFALISKQRRITSPHNLKLVILLSLSLIHI